ncbi:Hsp20/alpha crystallin family protein [Kocuria sp. LUK]|uniref:Heat-shock protein Hsp20 n=1 Tax=Kocuria flava TaxID=446860 RepID=A0A2N4T548_9MICC|nr:MULTISPECIES: Hsp20/alpha crystallin family protein [Kocuria]MCD1144819.1 Hsp20/alpha crystallin family protein [Kocuria sp. LUK]PLC13336.1 heat-shock protein Hsp20 [Kocuria flava]
MATMFSPFNDFDRLANSFFARPGLREMPMDLYRDGDEYILRADLPGIDPESVDVDVDGQLLTIRAERKLPEVKDVQWITRERQSSSFVRQLNLGQGIDIEGIAASYDNGVLTVTIPVSAQAKPRKIQVVSGGDDRQSLGGGTGSGGDRVIGEGELVNGETSTQSTEG